MPKKVEISYKTILFVALFVAILWVVYQIKEVLLGFFICLILMSSLNPSVKKMESWKFPRWLAILSLYIIVVLLLGFALGWMVPPLVNQTTVLIERIPEFFRQFKIMGIDEKVIASQFSEFTSIPASLIKFIFQIFSNVVAILALGVITFYLLLERKNLDEYLAVLFGEEKEREIEVVIDKIEERLGSWVRGELLLMLMVGVLSYIGFLIIGIDYALPLAVLAFLFEIIPNVGPTLAAFPAVLVGLTVSPFHALATTGWCFLVQQIENSFLVPRIMKKVVGVNPLISLLSLAVGFKLAGLGGVILAIPTYIALEVILKAVLSSKKFRTE